jgi:lipopolysaccharide biosynthesis protein
MKSLCLYSSYFSGTSIPYYVCYYLDQLLPHFSEIIFINNRKELDESSLQFLKERNIRCMMVDNEGYDFGMWWKAMQEVNVTNYERIGLVNDSCILFKDLNTDFKRINKLNADYTGLIISDRYATHLQSFFLMIGKKAIPVLKSYFDEHGVISDYRQLIQVYEIGLTQKMLSMGMNVASLYNNEHRANEKNPSFDLVEELIEEGMPMIKKKIVFRNYRGLEYYWVVRMNFETDYRKYFNQIRTKYGSNTIDLHRVMTSAPKQGHFDIFLFSIARGTANILRKVPGVRWMFHQSVNIYKRYFRAK